MTDSLDIGGGAQRPDRSVWKWFIGLIFLGLVIRIVLLLVYEPIAYGDSGSYLRLGGWVQGTGDRGFDGTRVPGYPVFVALFGLDPIRIWWGQMALGLMISGMLFYLGWCTTERASVGFLLGALYSLIPGQLLFEANLLSETLTTFFVVSTLALFMGLLRGSSLRFRFLLATGLGIAASLVGMVRPLFFPITLLFLPFLWFAIDGRIKYKLAVLATYAIFPVLIQGGWLLYMRLNWHVLSPTTMTGFSMVQHTGGYFEYLPDEYAAIRDTYIKYRDARIADRGVQTNAIWDAIPAITEASGIGFYELAREMNRLSWMLIRDNPELYIQNVVGGWINFWKSPVYWEPEVMQPLFIRSAFQLLAWVGQGISILANFGFLLLSLGILFTRKLRASIRMGVILWLSLAMVWLISILQTLLDHGDNPRFLVPMQMVVIFVVIVVTPKVSEHLNVLRKSI
jgi:hypothetical protein